MADGERHDEFGEKREPQRDLAVEDQLEVCVLADQQPVDQKAAQRLRAAKDKPGSSNPLTSVGGRSCNRVFFKTVPSCPAPAQGTAWAGRRNAIAWRHTARLSREGGVVAVPIRAVGREAEAGEADDHHRPS